MPETSPGTAGRHDDKADAASGQDVPAENDTGGAGSGEPGANEPGAGEPGVGGSGRRRGGRSKGGNTVLLWLKELVTVVVIAVVLSFLIKTFLFRAFFIPSESMVSTLEKDDRIFINLLVPEPIALERGDVVVFKDAQGWLPANAKRTPGPFSWVQDSLEFVGLLPDDNEQHLVKRVIGLPGDKVSCCDAGGRVGVNGVPLDESYINPAEIPTPTTFDVVVPAGKIWVMGDNRNHSADSRLHQETNGGFIDLSEVEGKATVIAWPINRWSLLGNYPEVFRNVPAGTPAGVPGQ